MQQKLKKVKIGKLTKGTLTRNAELLVLLTLFKITEGYKIVGKYIEGLFKRDKEKRAEKLIYSLLGLYISGGKNIQDLEILHKDEGLEKILGDKYFYSAAALVKNLLKYFRNMYLPEEWQTLMVASIRYKLKEAI